MSPELQLRERPNVRSATTGQSWWPSIGLEVHVQLATQTKLFCACPSVFGAAPNQHICPVCSGQPGALPRLNAQAPVLAARAALAFGCDLQTTSQFDRKNYFYIDLPKGYQITQFFEPYASGGGLMLSTGHFVPLVRIHIEEDAGKSIHAAGQESLVDLNRAGVPLIESVTEPSLQSSDQAAEFLQQWQETLRWIGVSDCDMEKGSLRCDVNISVALPDQPLGTKVEIKNLNSFRHVKAAVDFEVQRQIELLEASEARPVAQETRGFDAQQGRTFVMRSKADAHDYRYLVEPDLGPVDLTAEVIERERQGLPELPSVRRLRYTSQLGLSEYDAGVLTRSRGLSDFFEATLRRGPTAKVTANWINNELLAASSNSSGDFDSLALSPFEFAELLNRLETGKLQRDGARQALAHSLEHEVTIADAVESLGLEQAQDPQLLRKWCSQVIAEQQDVVAEVRSGNHKALGALMGPVMRLSQGRANPHELRGLLLQLIQADSSTD